MVEAACKRFWDLEKSVEMLRVERDTLAKRVKHLEWFDREMREKQAAYETTHKLYKNTTEAKLRELARELEMAKGEAADAKEEVKLLDITIDGLRKQLADLEEERGKSEKKVAALIERERQEVSKFMLFERIRMVKEFRAGGSANWDLEELEQMFQDEGYSMPSSGGSGEESGDEEEVNSHREIPG